MFRSVRWDRLFAEVRLGTLPGMCVRQLYYKATCTICYQVCPVRAVSYEPQVHVKSEICVGCGLCVAACPTGYFYLSSPTYSEIVGNGTNLRKVVVSCTKDTRAKRNVTVPCLGYLPGAVLAFLAARCQSIYLYTGFCHDCDYKTGNNLIQKHFSQATLLLKLCGINRPIEIVNDTNGGSIPVAVNLSRRDFFTFLKWKSSETVKTVLTGQDIGKPLKHNGNSLPFRRQILLEMLSHAPDFHADQPIDFLEITGKEIDLRCNGCGYCADFCPSGALKKEVQGNAFRLLYRPNLCLACGLCFDLCPQQAIQITCITAGGLVDNYHRQIFQRSFIKCPQCGMTFVPVDSGTTCPDCAKKMGLKSDIKTFLNL